LLLPAAEAPEVSARADAAHAILKTTAERDLWDTRVMGNSPFGIAPVRS
jgi:hypothetical protein